MTYIDVFAPPSVSTGTPLRVTNAAIERIDHLRRADPDRTLMIMVSPGGCSGFLYQFKLLSPAPRDCDFFAGHRVACDRASSAVLAGTTLDYEETLTGSRFIVQPDQDQFHQCSCGISFGKK